MASSFALENLTVTRKLGLGFGSLLALTVLLAATGLFGLNNDRQSLSRINQLGSIFDSTVFAREANYAYALNADADKLVEHDQNMQSLTRQLAEVTQQAQDGTWPASDLGELHLIDQTLRTYTDAHRQALAAQEVKQALIKSNELLSSLQDHVNVLYKAEETRAAQSVELVTGLLAAVTLVVLLLGGLTAWRISRQIVVPLQQTLQASERIANGDLTVELHSERADELGQLLRATGSMSRRLREVIAQIGHSSHQLVTAAGQLATITAQTRAGIDSQKHETDHVATAIGEMAATVQEVARNSEEAAMPPSRPTSASAVPCRCRSRRFRRSSRWPTMSAPRPSRWRGCMPRAHGSAGCST